MALGIFVASCGLSHCGMWARSLPHADMVAPWHVGSISPTRDRTLVPCIGRQILNH